MNHSYKISVLDQIPIHNNLPSHLAPAQTIALAKQCDALRYYRYWIAEHHDTEGYACSCPEIMIAEVAAATKNIRVGSGGVMLSHYSPYKVAETFRLLSSLHPNRIDLGVGRAPGGNSVAASALAFPHHANAAELYAQKVFDLSGFLHNNLPTGHPYSTLKTIPEAEVAPELWLLGSGAGSAEFAGDVGAGFALALFIGTHNRPKEIIDAYRNAFKPITAQQKSKVMLAVAVICAEDSDEAVRIASTHTYWKVQAFRHGVRIPLLPPEDCLNLKQTLSIEDQAYYDETLNSMIVGTADKCRSKMNKLADEYDADEIMVVNVCYDFEDRKRSYQLLAEEFELGNKVATEQIAI